MKKKVNLGLLIMATGLVLLAAAFFVACGPVEEEDPTYTITFKNGDETVKTFSDLKKGDSIPTPTFTTPLSAPKATLPKDTSDTSGKTFKAGFYKNPGTDTRTQDGWASTNGGDKVELNELTVTGPQTFYARWPGTGAEYSEVQFASSVTASDSTIQKAVATIKADNTRNNNTAYTLVLAGTSNPATIYDTPMNSGAIALDADNIKLTVTSTAGAQRTIKSTVTGTTGNPIFLTVGNKNTKYTNISLTLDKIVLEGVAGFEVGADGNDTIKTSGTAVNDSLVRVQNGATLILQGSSAIKGHKNSATSFGGDNGNGSAVCVADGGTLYIKEATIEANQASGSSTNRNLVGGIFAIGKKNALATVKIDTGYINGNKCEHTRDIYITEYVDFTMAVTSDMTIGDFTINSDVDNTITGNPVVNTTIKIPSQVKKSITLNLRTTGDIDAAQTRWTDKVVLQGINGYTLQKGDLDNFKMGQFRGNVTTTREIQPTSVPSTTNPHYRLKLDNTTATESKATLEKVTS